jgi:cell division septation protein DedD
MSSHWLILFAKVLLGIEELNPVKKTVYVTLLVAVPFLVGFFFAFPRLHHPPEILVTETAAKEPAPRPPVPVPSAPAASPARPAPARSVPPPSVPARSVPAPPSRPVFEVQVGAFKDRASADALAAKLSGRYQQTILVAPATVKGQTLYRVRFLAETKPDAETLAATLRQNDKLLPWIVVPLP